MKTIKTLVLALIICCPLMAYATDCSAPDKFAKSVSEDVIKILENEKNETAKTQKLEAAFARIVDIPWMGRFALGKHIREITPAEQTEFNKAYREYLLSSYIPSFKKYNGEKVDITGVGVAGNDQLIMTNIQRSAGAPISINYRVTKKDGCYKVRDIIAEGVSLINTQRQDFDSVINTKSFAELITLLKAKNVVESVATK